MFELNILSNPNKKKIIIILCLSYNITSFLYYRKMYFNF